MHVARWGNSLAVRLPKALVEELGLQPGDTVEIVTADPGRIAVARDDRRAAAVERMRGRLKIPDDFRLDRDEANPR